MALPTFQLRAINYGSELSSASMSRKVTTDHPLAQFMKGINSRHDAQPTESSEGPAKGDPLSDGVKALSVSDDPLGGVGDPLSGGATNVNFDGLDPLSMMMMGDPLSAPLMMPDSSAGGGVVSARDNRTASIEEAKLAAAQKFEEELTIPWQVRKQQILKDYQVSSIKVTANFMRDENNKEDEKEIKSVDRSKTRLQALESLSGSAPTVELSMKEYIDKITQYNEDLQTAWANGERVRSIKIVVKCTKLLGDMTVPMFYPSVFILVTEILDTFGDIVYERIKGKAQEPDAGAENQKPVLLRPDFTAADINVTAKETCRNWFYKASSIRDLLPRIYMEMALLRCYRFLSNDEYPQVLGRLASMIRGIGDPLVRVYAQCYLARSGATVCPETKDYINTMVYDYLFSFKEQKEDKAQKVLKRMDTTFEEYLRLQSPAVEWILKCAGKNASKAVFTTALKHYRDYCSNSMVLFHFINCFDPKHYAPNAAAMVALIKRADPSKASIVDLFETMAARFTHCPPPEDQRLQVLNEVWKVVTKCDNLKQYIKCSTAWFDVIIHHYSALELNVLLRDMVKHLSSADGDELSSVGKELDPLVKLLVDHCYDFNGAILISGELLLILDKFKESRKAEHCKDLLQSFAKHSDQTNDPVLINTLFEVSRTLHDSMDSLTAEGEMRFAASLICSFIGKIDFGKDLERQLNTYVECRAAFCNMDEIKYKLILCVNSLAMKTHDLMGGKHSAKTSAFIKACLAFNHITIPSIDDVFVKLHLLLNCSFVALRNQCLPQTDTFLKQAIGFIPEAPTTEEFDGKKASTEAKLTSFLGAFLGLLVVVPGSPEFGPFYLLHGLLKAVPRFQWKPDSGYKTRVLIQMLGVCSAFSQKKLPYNVEGVDSNDTLYGGSKEYHDELNELVGTIMQQIVEHLTELGAKDDKTCKITQAELILTLVNEMLNVFLASESTLKFCKKLLGLCDKNSSLFNKKLLVWFDSVKTLVVAKGTSQ